jgi:hypothetical protein
MLYIGLKKLGEAILDVGQAGLEVRKRHDDCLDRVVSFGARKSFIGLLRCGAACCLGGGPMRDTRWATTGWKGRGIEAAAESRSSCDRVDSGMKGCRCADGKLAGHGAMSWADSR